MLTKKILAICILMAFSKIVDAQTIVGAWKTISNVMVNTDGSKKDLTEMQFKHWPCMANLQTIFEANGKQYLKSEQKCGSVDYNQLPASTWKMNGNTISITNTDVPTPLGNTSVYKVAFLDKTAIFTHVYTPEEQSKLHNKKVKELVITYHRL